MSSEFGNRLRISVFGESHGDAIGVVINGLPAGEKIDMNALSAFMNRRRGGKGGLTTARNEADAPEFLSGVKDGVTCAFPLAAVIRNGDHRSGDYEALKHTPRPGHADFTAHMKWNGFADMRGGGHFSGRLTAPICIAGGIAKQILERRGIYIGAHISEIAGIPDTPFPIQPQNALFQEIAQKPLPVLSDEAAQSMKNAIEQAAQALDSVGGIVECAVTGVPTGLGSPMFDGIENRLAQALFAIPAVKGVEFGLGFESARRLGSENNDEFFIGADGGVKTLTNNAGGILGGISTGMPITFRCAFKPTPSISKIQNTVNLDSHSNETLQISGRHDPCVVIRAVPVVEAVAAVCMLDLVLEGI